VYFSDNVPDDVFTGTEAYSSYSMNDTAWDDDTMALSTFGYEPFHLTGEEGKLDEVDDYCEKRLAANA
jgi:hypothetical protein